MANGHGGYRKPTNPAPASGPGRLARRTDGGPGQPIRDLPNAKYGENAAFRTAQQAAPMSPNGAGSGAAPAAPSLGPDLSGIVGLGEPSQRPDEPITAGMPFGAGPGPTTAPDTNMTPEVAARLRSYLPVLILLASQDDVDPHTKQFVRQLRGELG
jgi:hypothetical protein